MSDYTHDEECEEEEPEFAWSWWDLLGVFFATLSGLFAALQAGSGMMAYRMAAAANHSRTKRLVKAHLKAEERNRREMAAHLRDSVYSIEDE